MYYCQLEYAVLLFGVTPRQPRTTLLLPLTREDSGMSRRGTSREFVALHMHFYLSQLSVVNISLITDHSIEVGFSTRGPFTSGCLMSQLDFRECCEERDIALTNKNYGKEILSSLLLMPDTGPYAFQCYKAAT